MGCSEDTDIGEGSRAVVAVSRLPGAALVAGFGLLNVERSFPISSSSSVDVSSCDYCEDSFLYLPSSSLSLNSILGTTVLLVAAFFVALVDLIELSDSVVGIRGTFEGRRGLKAGTLRFEAGYTTCSFGSLRGGIVFVIFLGKESDEEAFACKVARDAGEVDSRKERAGTCF